MENLKIRLKEMTTALSEWLNDQTWFQQLKAKWEELDPQSQMYLQISSVAMSGLAVVLVLFSFMWSVHKSRQELFEKSELLSMIQAGNDELRNLKDMTSGVTSAGGQNAEPWSNYFESVAGTAGIPKTVVTVSDSKSGTTNDTSKEVLFDVSMKKVNIRQAVRFAQSLESGSRPVKLRNLVIDTLPDGTGYLDVTLSVSAFSLVAAK